MLQASRMKWMRHRLRDTDVWAKVDAAGALAADRNGRVEIVYKTTPDARVYRAGARNLVAVGGDPIEIDIAPAETTPATPATPATAAATGDAIQVWTDRAC